MNLRFPSYLAISLVCILTHSAFAADTPATKPAEPPKPDAAPAAKPATLANVAYGTHERRRLGGRVFVAVARVSQRHGRPEKQRSRRARVHAALVRGGERRADLARSAAVERVDAQQPLRRPRVRLHGPDGHQDTRQALR